MNALEPWHLLIIAGVVVLMFGAKRLPDSARSLGRSMRIFRSEMHEAKQNPAVDQAAAATTDTPIAATPIAAPAPVAVPAASDR
jgi:sec-independent protein translocase protein TatA